MPRNKLSATAWLLGVMLVGLVLIAYWTLAMALLSLLAAIVAFWGPRLKSDQLATLRKPGLAGAFFYGFIFSLGTSAAPLLLLLTVAASYAGTAYGVVLSLAFGLGRGLPFLLVGVFAGAVTRLARLAALPRRTPTDYHPSLGRRPTEGLPWGARSILPLRGRSHSRLLLPRAHRDAKLSFARLACTCTGARDGPYFAGKRPTFG